MWQVRCHLIYYNIQITASMVISSVLKQLEVFAVSSVAAKSITPGTHPWQTVWDRTLETPVMITTTGVHTASTDSTIVTLCAPTPSNFWWHVIGICLCSRIHCDRITGKLSVRADTVHRSRRCWKRGCVLAASRRTWNILRYIWRHSRA